MRAMVTGGAGFIGSNLVDRLLAEGHDVDVVDDLSTGSLANLADARACGGALRFHHLDVRSGDLVDLVRHRRPEVVFHLAAQADVRVSVERPVFDAEVNVLGTIQVLEGARAAGTAKVVFAASGGTLYGEPEAADLPVDERQPHRPLSPYGVSKKAAIDYLVAYGEAGVVAIFAGNLLAGRPCVVFGDGSQTRDYVYVDDVVDAFARAARRGGGLVMNIGTGQETSVSKLYEKVAKACGSDLAPRPAPARAGEVQRSALDPRRAGLHLGWKPWTPLGDGVASVVNHVRRATL